MGFLSQPRALAAVLCAGLGLLTGADTAAAATTSQKCGAAIESRVKSSHDGFTTQSSANYVNIPSANMKVIVPNGTSQCVKVRFSVSGACSANAGDRCGVIVGGATFYPNVQIDVAPGGAALSPGANAYEWATRLDPGTYHIQVSARVTTNAELSIDAWTLDVETLE